MIQAGTAEAVLREGTGLGPEADGSLGYQGTGDVGIAETTMDLVYSTIQICGLDQTPGNTAASEHLQPGASNMVKRFPQHFPRLVNTLFRHISLQSDL